jgi:hypothetical protein
MASRDARSTGTTFQVAAFEPYMAYAIRNILWKEYFLRGSPADTTKIL